MAEKDSTKEPQSISKDVLYREHNDQPQVQCLTGQKLHNGQGRSMQANSITQKGSKYPQRI